MTASANAAVITNYQFETASGFNATSTIANVTAGAFGDGASVTVKLADPAGDTSGLDAEGNTGFDTGAGAAFSNGQNGLTVSPDGSTASTQANAFSEGEYFSFTVSADTGFELDLTSLTFKGALNNAQSAYTWALTSSVDGHAVDNIIDTGVISSGSNQAGTYESFIVDLTGSQFQNIAAETDVEFRFYLYNYTGTVTNRSTYLDNVVLNGTVSAIPEPSTYAMIAGMLAFVSVMVRRRG